MDIQTPAVETKAEPKEPTEAPKGKAPASTRVPAIIVGFVVAAVAGLSMWYMIRPQPLLVQGEVDATRLDLAARVDGRVADIPVVRGQDVAAGAVLVRIDNPETIAKREQALAAKIVAEAQLANINAGTRIEVIAARKAALERAEAGVVLAQKTYDRVSQLTASGNTPIARLDQATDALQENQRVADQARSAHEQAVNGYTKEEREIAAADVGKALADIKAVQSIIDQMVITGRGGHQEYSRPGDAYRRHQGALEPERFEDQYEAALKELLKKKQGRPEDRGAARGRALEGRQSHGCAAPERGERTRRRTAQARAQCRQPSRAEEGRTLQRAG